MAGELLAEMNGVAVRREVALLAERLLAVRTSVEALCYFDFLST